MIGKATAVAPSNIAFIKYWGLRDPRRVLPCNPSISMTLSRCVSRCTVEAGPVGDRSSILWRSERGGLEPAPAAFADGIRSHLARLAEWAGVEASFRVATENSFPTGAGIASSASGFAALTLATIGALGRELSPRQHSVLSRRSGSGSAARSALGGYVEWPAGDSEEEGHAVELAPARHWELCDLVAVVDSTPKRISSRRGHRAAQGSPYFERRQELLPVRLERVRRAIRERNLAEMGPVLEEEAIDLHLIAMSSRPPIFYWQPATLAVLEAVRALRQGGLGVWATIDAGPNVHLICEPSDEERVAAEIGARDMVRELIRDRVGDGPRLVDEHLR